MLKIIEAICGVAIIVTVVIAFVFYSKEKKSFDAFNSQRLTKKKRDK